MKGSPGLQIEGFSMITVFMMPGLWEAATV